MPPISAHKAFSGCVRPRGRADLKTGRGEVHVGSCRSDRKGAVRLGVAARRNGSFDWHGFRAVATLVYGALAALLGTLFFPSGNETAAFLSSLAIFGAGFVVLLFGALVFGALGGSGGPEIPCHHHAAWA